MGNLRRWSSSASGNSSVAGGANTINFAEGQTPGSVNNSAREMMAQVRSIYTPAEWGWVEFSATASVASQTTIKLTGNQTTNWTAGRRWRLKSGSTTRYGSVVSSSFTAETTITVSVDSGSLSASHSLAALAGIDSNHTPAFAAGSVSAPSITTNGDTNTGFWFPAADTIAASTGGAERLRVDSSGNVAIGTTSTSDKLHIRQAGSVYAKIQCDNVGAGAGWYFTNTTTNWLIGSGPVSGGGEFAFYDATRTSERFLIDTSGNVLVTGPGGLGYGTGSGGTVTQLTSKATSVTINKTNGSITTSNGALANNITVPFAVFNNTVADTDTIVLSMKSGNTQGAYLYWVDAVAAGQFNVCIRNISGGTLSEALTLNFAVIKAVTS